MANGEDDLFDFPCAFPLKIMGLASDDLVLVVGDLVRRHVPDFKPATMTVRSSSAGRYISLSCTITATSKRQLDALYRELSSHPLVKFVL